MFAKLTKLPAVIPTKGPSTQTQGPTPRSAPGPRLYRQLGEVAPGTHARVGHHRPTLVVPHHVRLSPSRQGPQTTGRSSQTQEASNPLLQSSSEVPGQSQLCGPGGSKGSYAHQGSATGAQASLQVAQGPLHTLPLGHRGPQGHRFLDRGLHQREIHTQALPTGHGCWTPLAMAGERHMRTGILRECGPQARPHCTSTSRRCQ